MICCYFKLTGLENRIPLVPGMISVREVSEEQEQWVYWSKYVMVAD